ncbi:MAG: acyl-CoA dehydrogenase [Gammaproteobacteria bacterium]|nr:acyl-CoA dehydrogenase [Gammaproteobacteria bacterium]
MDFTFTEEQELAAQALRGLLDDHCSGADLRRAAEARGAGAFAAARALRRERLKELGLAGVLVPTSAGGLGLAPIDLARLAEEAGRAALPEPLIDVEGIALPMLAQLAAAAPGAHDALAAALAQQATVLAVTPGSGPVAAAVDADYLLVGRSPDELALHRRDALRLTSVESVDPLRRLATVELTDAAPLAVLQGSVARQAWDAAASRSAALIAAQQLGLGARMIAIAVAYALDRKQFGKAIGANQAVKHALADAQMRVEFARPVVYAACAALDASAPPDASASLRVSHAFVAAADAADRAARAAIQVHGAMGYSWEVDLQFYAKRAWTSAALAGGRSAHFARLHRALLDGSAATGPDHLFDAGAARA